MVRGVGGLADVRDAHNMTIKKCGGKQDSQWRLASQGGWEGFPIYNPVIHTGDTRYSIGVSIPIRQWTRDFPSGTFKNKDNMS